MNDSTANLCPAALRRMLDSAVPPELHRMPDAPPARPFMTPSFSLRRSWNRLMTWTPTDEQLRQIVSRATRFLRVCNSVLNVAVIVAVIFLVVEIGLAFSRGGAVERVLGGAR